jgi:hypothetical protein
LESFTCASIWDRGGVKLGSLTFAQLANVQTVGIGLYLALAVIQAVTEGGVGALRRRAMTLEAASLSTRRVSQREEAASILADVGSLEMSFQKVNRTILYTVLTLFTASVIYFAYCTVWQDSHVGPKETLFILSFYLLLPIAIFVGASLHVKRRCSEADGRIKRLQSDFLSATFGP